jgi:hypothetical protein
MSNSNLSRSVWATFRQVLRGLDEIAEKQRRAEIRAGKQKETVAEKQTGLDRRLRGASRKGAAKRPTEKITKQKAGKKIVEKQSSGTSRRGKASGNETLKSVSASAKVSPSRLRRSEARAAKFESMKAVEVRDSRKAVAVVKSKSKEVKVPSEKRGLDPVDLAGRLQWAKGRKSLSPKVHTFLDVSPFARAQYGPHMLGMLYPGYAFAEEWVTSFRVRNSESYRFRSYVPGPKGRGFTSVVRDYGKAVEGLRGVGNQKRLHFLRGGIALSKKPNKKVSKAEKSKATKVVAVSSEKRKPSAKAVLLKPLPERLFNARARRNFNRHPDSFTIVQAETKLVGLKGVKVPSLKTSAKKVRKVSEVVRVEVPVKEQKPDDVIVPYFINKINSVERGPFTATAHVDYYLREYAGEISRGSAEVLGRRWKRQHAVEAGVLFYEEDGEGVTALSRVV